MGRISLSNQSTHPFVDFQTSVQAVLDFLHHRLGFQLWMFTRVEGEDWIALTTCDHGYGVKPGDVFRWSDSFCSRMVDGLGPQIAPRSQDIPAYASAPIGAQVPIGAYIGIPVHDTDGLLFGTLCAIDPEPQMEAIQQEYDLIKLQTQLLTTILHNELRAQATMRRCERAEAESELDFLTNLHNRRGWESLISLEEERCIRYGSPAGVILIDLDNLKLINDSAGHAAGDRLLQSAAQLIQQTIRPCDVAARLGGDEFAVLIVESAAETIQRIAERIQQNLQDGGVPASVGWAIRIPGSPLQETLKLADRKMYEQKTERKQQRGIQDLCKDSRIL